MTPDSWSTGVAANVPGAQHVPVLVRLQPFVGRHQKGQQCPIAKFNKIQLPRPGHHPDHSFRETLSMGGRLVDPAMLVDSGLFKLSIQTWFCTVCPCLRVPKFSIWLLGFTNLSQGQARELPHWLSCVHSDLSNSDCHVCKCSTLAAVHPGELVSRILKHSESNSITLGIEEA